MSWSGLLIEFAKTHSSFTAEEAWKWCQASSMDEPPSPNRKGGLFRRTLVQPGHVIPQSTENAKNKSAKGRGVIRWKSTLCADGHELVPVHTRLAQIHSDVNLHKITLMEGLNKAYQIGVGWGGI